MAITVPHSEVAGYPQWEWVEGHFIAVRKLKCKYTDLVDLIQQIGTYPDSVFPAQYGVGPPDALARSIKGRGIDRIGPPGQPGIITYLNAIVTVHYSTKGPTWVAERGLFSEALAGGTEVESVPMEGLAWHEQGNVETPALGACVPKQRAMLDYVTTYYQVLDLAPMNLVPRIGCCNSNEVIAPTLKHVFAPEQLLYRGCATARSVQTGRLSGWNVTIRYGIHPVGWNTFWRKHAGKYEPLYYATTKKRYVAYPPVPF